MTTTRDAFDAWFAKRRGAAMLFKSITGGYEWARTSEACEVWEAATAAERERCALVCDAKRIAVQDCQGGSVAATFFQDAADAIRSGT